MKYISTYKLFESNSESKEEIIQYLKDIFQELKDMGFSISVSAGKEPIYEIEPLFTKPNEKEIYVTIKRLVLVSSIQLQIHQYFKFEEIEDYVSSAIDYMSSVDFDLSDWNKRDILMKKSRGENILEISLRFVEVIK